jgi:hypothetical protein
MGPIGLSLSLDLAWRAIDRILIDQGDGAKIGPISVRSMELFRRCDVSTACDDADSPTTILRTWSFAAPSTGDSRYPAKAIAVRGAEPRTRGITSSIILRIERRTSASGTKPKLCRVMT